MSTSDEQFTQHPFKSQAGESLADLLNRNVAEPEAFCRLSGFALLPQEMQDEFLGVLAEAKAIRQRYYANLN